MLEKLFQSDKSWYDVMTCRLYGTVYDTKKSQADVAGGWWALQKIKNTVKLEVSSKPNYQTTELLGDIPYEK